MKNKKIICHDIHNNKTEVDSSQLIFRPSIYGILIENNKILLSKQWDGYDFPGGKIDIHETIEETLKREFYEETGVKIELIKPIHCETSFFNPNYSAKRIGEYCNCPLIYFSVKKIGGNLSKDNISKEEQDYIDAPEWINLNEIDSIKFYNSVDSIKVIKKALR